jgi:proline dehydrogenase
MTALAVEQRAAVAEKYVAEKRVAETYVAGPALAAAVERAGQLAVDGFACNLGYLAPEATDADMAKAAVSEYRRLASALADTPAGTRLEVDLPHIGLDLGPTFCLAQLGAIASCLPAGRFMQTGAEETHRTTAVIETVLRVSEAELPLRGTLQANLRRSVADADRLTAAGISLRLVKGAFAEPPAVAWPFGEPTNVALIQLARSVQRSVPGVSVGTHDQVIQQALPGAEIEMLLGSRPDVAAALADHGRKVRLYVPYGPDCDAYVRSRIAEARRHVPAPAHAPRPVPPPGGPCTF